MPSSRGSYCIACTSDIMLHKAHTRVRTCLLCVLHTCMSARVVV